MLFSYRTDGEALAALSQPQEPALAPLAEAPIS